MTRVSVVVPLYNQGRFLREALASVAAQDHPDLEAVVVDDGSTDGSRAVARALAAELHGTLEVRVLAQRNGGLPAARNAGIAAATGAYVLPLDADDRLGEGFVARCAALLDARPDAAIAYGDQRNFGEDDTFHRHAEYDFARLTRQNHIGVASLFRRRAWEDVGGYAPLDSYEDWEFWIACGERGHAGRRVPGAVFDYRVRAGSMYDGATKRDQRLKAQIVLRHPRLYAAAELEWAAGVLDGEPAALAVDGPLGVVPSLGGPGPHFSGARLPGVRRRRVLAQVEELLADPRLGALLRGAAAGPHDEVTVLLAGALDEAGAPVAGLEARLAELGLDGDEGPDLLATALSTARLAQEADALATLAPPPRLLSGLPLLAAP